MTERESIGMKKYTEHKARVLKLFPTSVHMPEWKDLSKPEQESFMPPPPRQFSTKSKK